MIPGPTTGTVDMEYNISNSTGAELMIINSFGNYSQTYSLEPNTSSLQLNLNSFTSGVLNVILLVNGEYKDSESLVLQKEFLSNY